MELTNRQIQLTRPPQTGRITLLDGNGLQLRIISSDKKSWSLQYRYQGSMRKYTIGCYPETSLKDARAKTATVQAEVQAGSHPQTIKRASRSPFPTNFEECFEEYLRDHLKVHLKSWPEYERAMRKDGLPFIGQTELTAVDKATIRAVIRRITERGRMVLANRVLQYISRMLKWAVGVGYINTNLAADTPKPSKERSKERVLTLDEVRGLLFLLATLWRTPRREKNQITVPFQILYWTILHPSQFHIGYTYNIPHGYRLNVARRCI